MCAYQRLLLTVYDLDCCLLVFQSALDGDAGSYKISIETAMGMVAFQSGNSEVAKAALLNG